MEAKQLQLFKGERIHDGTSLLNPLQNQMDDQNGKLSHQEQHERQRSGLRNLRTQHNRIFGYLMAVNKAWPGTC